MKKVIASSLLAAAIMVSMGGVVVAQTGATIPTGFTIPTAIPTTGAQLVGLIQTITNWLFVIFLLIAVVYIILAAFQFLTGGGDPDQLSQARTKLIFAAVAVIVAVVARGVPAVVQQIITG